MLAWAFAISILGIYNIAQQPIVFKAFNPAYIYYSFSIHGKDALKMFGGVILCLTGVEAMYGDMGHFGKGSIRVAWLFIVFPAVTLSYMGQCAHLFLEPEHYRNIFFMSIPRNMFWPMFVLATLATIIAAQALITASFSLVSQAISMSYFPSIRIKHTSKKYQGQVYIPTVNYMLMFGSLLLILVFQSSKNLADAFSLAVSVVLLVTSVLYVIVVLYTWEVHIIFRILFVLIFSAIFKPILVLFVVANVMKFTTGGWLPILTGIIVSAIMIVWKSGIEAIAQISQKHGSLQSYDDFQEMMNSKNITRVKRMGAFLVDTLSGVPRYIVRFMEKHQSMPEIIIFVHIKRYNLPEVDEEYKFSVIKVQDNMYTMTARYGFAETRIDISEAMEEAKHIIASGTWAERNEFGSRTSIDVIRNRLRPIVKVIDDVNGNEGDTVVFIDGCIELPEDESVLGPETTGEHHYQNYDLTFYLQRPHLTVDKNRWFFTRYPISFFIFMWRNTREEVTRLHLPPQHILEIGNIVIL